MMVSEIAMGPAAVSPNRHRLVPREGSGPQLPADKTERTIDSLRIARPAPSTGVASKHTAVLELRERLSEAVIVDPKLRAELGALQRAGAAKKLEDPRLEGRRMISSRVVVVTDPKMRRLLTGVCDDELEGDGLRRTSRAVLEGQRDSISPGGEIGI